MKTKRRIIAYIDLLHPDGDLRPPDETVFTHEGNLHFTIMSHYIGWDLKTAEALIRKMDGYVDAIVLNGVHRNIRAGNLHLVHKPTQRLLSGIKYSQCYTGNEIRNFFANWTLLKLLHESPNLLKGKKALFHCAMVTPCVEVAEKAGANILCADPLTLAGVPVVINGLRNLQKTARVLKSAIENLPGSFFERGFSDTLLSWIKRSDIFVASPQVVKQIASPAVLRGKTLVVDSLDEKTHEVLKDLGVSNILELIPKTKSSFLCDCESFALLEAVIDQIRLAEDTDLSFNDYLLKFVDQIQMQPGRLENISPVARKVGFIIHPLKSEHVFKDPRLRWLKQTPKTVQNAAEHLIARGPVMKYGQIRGAKSYATNVEVSCQVYVLPATPKQLMAMDENSVYERLIAAAEAARKDGCCMIGLGAYTKVIGDAGLTVSQKASIPVTNGNSYSAAATLWAAREMSERLGFLKLAPEGKHIRGRAMVIGATGSIGRVSSHLLSLVFDDLVLVATRPDRLLELRQEIHELAPRVTVRVCTDPSNYLASTDLIVTATSNQSGRLLDIEQVKPGAVICDCSRPTDISPEEAALRPDVMIIESGEIDLPGNIKFTCDIDLPEPSVYACLAETILLAMENRLESFSTGKELSLKKVKEIYKIGLKHGAKLAAIRGPLGIVTEKDIARCRKIAAKRLKVWKSFDEGEKRQHGVIARSAATKQSLPNNTKEIASLRSQ